MATVLGVDARPAPCRLALKIPDDARWRICPPRRPRMSQFRYFVPGWLCTYRQNQQFMQFGRFEVVYILHPHIRPRAHYDRQEDMPPGMYAEAFEGHHDSTFVSIDPHNRHAVQFWDIPEYCWEILKNSRPFPHLPHMNAGALSREDRAYWRRCEDGSLPKATLRFLACVRESSQTQQHDERWPKHDFPPPHTPPAQTSARLVWTALRGVRAFETQKLLGGNKDAMTSIGQ
jgi:hypothetical protein